MSEEKTWKVGDKVRLTTGGPTMVVIGYGSGDMSGKKVIRCRWFDNNNQEHTNTYPPESVELVTG